MLAQYTRMVTTSTFRCVTIAGRSTTRWVNTTNQTRRRSTSTNKNSILFAHANGFHKGMWVPVVEDLASIIPQALLPNLECMTFDFQGHGDRGRTSDTTSVDLEPARDWLTSTKQDIVDAAACLSSNAKCRVGVGSSLGGAALVLAQLENPDLFTHLILIEPVLVCSNDGKTPPDGVQAFRVASSPFERKARKRRDEFASLAEAGTFFQSRALWKKFDARAVQAYVDGGLVATGSDGAAALSLRCPPDYEAEVYLTVPMVSPSALQKLSCSTKVTLCVGQNSNFDLSGEEDGSALTYYGQHIWPEIVSGKGTGSTEMVVLEECTHHAAMERPMEIAKLVVEILSPSTDADTKFEPVQPMFVRD